MTIRCQRCPKHCKMLSLDKLNLDNNCAMTRSVIDARKKRDTALEAATMLHNHAADVAAVAMREYIRDMHIIHDGCAADKAQDNVIALPAVPEPDNGLIVLRVNDFDVAAVFVGRVGRTLHDRIDMPTRYDFQHDDRLRHIDINRLIPAKLEKKEGAA